LIENCILSDYSTFTVWEFPFFLEQERWLWLQDDLTVFNEEACWPGRLNYMDDFEYYSDNIISQTWEALRNIDSKYQLGDFSQRV